MRKSNLFVIMMGSLLFSCGEPTETTENALSEYAEQEVPVKKVSNEAISGIIKSIPSPIEISVLIRESGSDYDSNILNPADNYKNYNTQISRAINLGIYSTDLGYVNLYNKNSDALSYLKAVKGLSDELNIGQFFNFETIKDLASNSNNMEELLYLTISNFEKINQHLQDKGRTNHSILILTGGWLEALHISCIIANKTPNEELNAKIGEQKIVLEKLILLLSNFTEDKQINELVAKLNTLKTEFDNINISYEYQESTMQEVDGMLVVVDQNSQQVNITDEDIKKISTLVSEIRAELIK